VNQGRFKYGQLNPREASKPDAEAEIAKLKSELKRVTTERDILKKAAAYFANNPE
jgi:transposase